MKAQEMTRRTFKVTTTLISELIRKIHSYSYGIENRTERVVNATLDVSKSAQMRHSLKEPVISKVS